MLRAAQVLQLTVIALLGLAVVMVHSAGMSIGGGDYHPLSMLWSRPAMYAAASVAVMFAVSRLNLRRVMAVEGWRNPVVWLTVVGLAMVVLTLVPGVGVTINGARRWLRLGPPGWGLTFQPSEIVKWAMVLALASWCARREETMRSFRRGLAPALALVAAAAALIVIEDLGTAALVGVVAFCILLAGGARWWQLFMLIPPAASAVVYVIIKSPYRLERILSYRDPWADPRGAGYQAIQSMLAIADGGLAGRGLGNGVQKFDYLPADTTDFVFGIICEEMGLAGAVLVVGLFLVLMWVGLGIVRQCRDTFSRLVGFGVLLTVGLQALINLMVVTVLVPTKGIALPLVSSGGTGWILTGFALGLLTALDTANRLDAEGEQIGAGCPIIGAAAMAGRGLL